MVIPSELEAAGRVQRQVLQSLSRLGYGEACAFAIRLAMEEALCNAIKHGNGMNPRKQVKVQCDIDARQAVIIITDQGAGFDPAKVPDPTADENLEKPSGRGIMLMRAYMDEVCFSDRGNQVRMVKHNR
jgi:serine/threonine-protein kinase RsbW